jgi:phosphohistidine phosphatase
MKTLYLLRHAKSSWDDPSLADFERPLNGRGRIAAPFMGKLMRKRRLLPEIVISSPATRARATAEMAVEAAGLDAVIVFEPSIYEASPNALRKIASGIDDEYRSAMLVGHNPGMEGFLYYLAGTLEPMPTAGLAVLELDIKKWSDIDAGCARGVQVLRPKTEMGG